MRDTAIAVLIVLGVALQLFAVAGVTVMRSPFTRLHYAAAATTFGPFLLAGAVIVDAALAEPGLKALLTAMVLTLGNPVLTHATGRAALLRARGSLAPTPSEVEAG